MANLIIVESPTKIRTIKQILGDDYDVAASMGHVRDLPAARLNVDVKNDFEPKYAVIKGKEKLVRDLKSSVGKYDKVFLATDPDREGEAISWHLATLLGMDLNEKNRVTFNEITRTGIEAGMADPHKIDMNLVNAQQARRILDRLVGYRISPFVSQKIRRGLSAGRVQSVAVRLIVDREEEIRAFQPEEYWSIDAKFSPPGSRRVFPTALTADEKGKVKMENKEQADKYLARLENNIYTVDSLKKGTRRKQPLPPFITSTLQQDASRRLGFQTRRTMKVAQELYEGVNINGRPVGLITYMRTDSLRISEEARASAASYIKKTFGPNYLPEKPRYFKSRNKAQDAHEAIRPTNVSLTPEDVRGSLSSDQYKLYKLIWNRFLASMMAVCIQNTLKVEIKATDPNTDGRQYCIFSASGYTVKFDGFTKLYEFDDEKSGSKFPDLSEGDQLKRTLIQLCTAALIMTVYVMGTTDLSAYSPGVKDIGLLLLLGVVMTAAAYIAYFGLVVRIPSGSVAFFSYADPVVAVIISVFCLGEPFSIYTFIGAVMIIGAAIVAEGGFNKKQQERGGNQE